MASRQKTFKTIDEQIDILKEKGLVIDDIDYAKDILLRENYFFLMGYRHLFIKSERDRTFINVQIFANFMRCLILTDKFAILFLKIS